MLCLWSLCWVRALVDIHVHDELSRRLQIGKKSMSRVAKKPSVFGKGRRRQSKQVGRLTKSLSLSLALSLSLSLSLCFSLSPPGPAPAPAPVFFLLFCHQNMAYMYVICIQYDIIDSTWTPSEFPRS